MFGRSCWLLLVITMTVPTNAEDMNLCRAWAREYVRIAMEHNAEPLFGEPLAKLFDENYSDCLLAEEPPPLPDVPAATDEAWIKEMGILFRSPGKPGTEPAVASVEGDWATRCAAEYRTFNEKDGTVIRRNSGGKRVPCPLEK